MSFANIFSHSVSCLLVLLIVSISVQKLSMMRSQYFIFVFVSLASRDALSKKLLWPRSKRFLPAFFLEDFDGFLSYSEVFHPF